MDKSSPLSQYQALVATKQISFDESQQKVVELLEHLHLKLTTNQTSLRHKKIAIKGLYLWGKVGRGKTFLMDILVASLPKTICKRLHFHHFMQDVHHQLRKCAGRSDPLRHIAKQFSKKYRILCFDEFFVADIGDAMLLGNLLQYLFNRGVILVCTSNCAPNELYRNGLQRARFLPAIAAIERQTDVLHLAGKLDYRHRTLTFAQNYFELPECHKQRARVHRTLLARFGIEDIKHTSEHLALPSSGTVTVLGREIPYIAKVSTAEKRTICFEFSQLCQGPRSHLDYVELAKSFDTILLLNVPAMSGQPYETISARGTEDNGSNINVAAGETGQREVVLAAMDDAVRRFIALVDECYDSNLALFLTAHVPQSQLYNSGSLMFEFERTKSRLVEMTSVEYRDKRLA